VVSIKNKLQYLERKPHPLESWFLSREENRRTQRKTLGAKPEPTANSTYMYIWHWARIKPRPQSTLVGGEPSHHSTNPVSSGELSTIIIHCSHHLSLKA